MGVCLYTRVVWWIRAGEMSSGKGHSGAQWISLHQERVKEYLEVVGGSGAACPLAGAALALLPERPSGLLQ
jgi:hypothetical protein